MLMFPSGTFMMGCSASSQYGCNSDENPVHEVMLTQAFYLGRYEVTQAQWTAVMGSNPSFFKSASAEVPASQVPSRPVDTVSWNMIQGFETATGLRLPTEAEWEYACRAGSTTEYAVGSGSELFCADANTRGASHLGQFCPSIAPVAVSGYAPNAWGLFDMHGNVWEWVEDWYGSGYYAQSPAVDPPGPISGSYRVLRGGSWNVDSYYCRASSRNYLEPGFDFINYYGFRAARTP